jgi:hypothetical protein
MIVKIKIAFLPLCFVLLFMQSVSAEQSSTGVLGKLSFMVGDIYASPDGKNWTEAVFDMEIRIGDHIKTGEDSRCEVTLSDGTIVRMDENTIQQFEKIDEPLRYPPKSIFLSAGKLWLNARKIIAKEESFKVRTNKAVCAIRGTTFGVEEKNAYTRIRVLKGEVASWSSIFDNRIRYTPDGMPASSKPYAVEGPHPISMEEWVEVVSALQQITIDAKGGYEKQDFDLEKISKDPWVEWNMKRDNPLTK